MILFPNAKINIGLNVLEKREDGYHNIESIFYPIAINDALEAIKSEGIGNITLSTYGNPIPGSTENNLCIKAYNLLKTGFELPSVNIGLLKSIPTGAGLGGGSSDAAFFFKMLNEFFNLNLSPEELKFFAAQIGSDCTFFMENKPCLVRGKGDVIEPIQLDLSNYYIAVIHPKIHVDTKNAYSLIIPHLPAHGLKQTTLNTPVQLWRKTLINDFEGPIFKLHPELAEIKQRIYDSGALYTSMTGSGSALYGIFDKNPYLAEVLPLCKIWTIPPQKVK